MKHRFLLVLLLLFVTGVIAREHRMLIRIYVSDPEDIATLYNMNLDFATHAVTDHADVIVTLSELTEIQRRGFQTEVIQYEEDVVIPPEYHTVDETWVVLDSLHQFYPMLTELDTCGYSQRFGLPIPRLVISKNIGLREDEPAALINSMIHAREPMGNEVCLFTIRKILEDYPDSAYAQKFVDSMELHFVPIVNPEGWKYITDSSLADPWWRKNLRDNGNNGGPINPDSDGVDLNRNFDWRWTVGGDTDPTSWFYRGPYPASESEVQALVNLATNRKYVVGITYHSYGYLIFYCWEYDGQYTPDDATLTDIAQNLGTQIGGYTWVRTYGHNISSVWFYGQLGMYDFSIETAQSHFPPAESIPIETQKNFKGIRYLLNRTFYSGVTGHVRDTLTLQPLEATVEVLGLTGDSIVPRTSDSIYGRFYRLLQNGNYAMRFSKPGYIPKIISNIFVTSDSLTTVEVLLAQVPGVESDRITESLELRFSVCPNPFSNFTDITFSIRHGAKSIELKIYDATGRLVKTFPLPSSYSLVPSVITWDGRDDQNRMLGSGVYFLKISAGDYQETKKLLLIK